MSRNTIILIITLEGTNTRRYFKVCLRVPETYTTKNGSKRFRNRPDDGVLAGAEITRVVVISAYSESAYTEHHVE